LREATPIDSGALRKIPAPPEIDSRGPRIDPSGLGAMGAGLRIRPLSFGTKQTGSALLYSLIAFHPPSLNFTLIVAAAIAP
jgi:hypothetical protein